MPHQVVVPDAAAAQAVRGEQQEAERQRPDDGETLRLRAGAGRRLREALPQLQPNVQRRRENGMQRRPEHVAAPVSVGTMWTLRTLRTKDSELRTLDCGLKTLDCELRTLDCGLNTLDCGLKKSL